MQDKKKKTLLLIGITILTLVLGGVAVVTALRLQKLATLPVAPNVPQSQPQAAVAPVEINGCFGSFDIAPQQCSQTCTSNADCAGEGSLQCITGMCRNPDCSGETDCLCPLPTATPEPTPTVTPIPPASCNNGCSVDTDCEGDLVCEGGVCRNYSCLEEADCVCEVPVPTNTPVPTNEPQPTSPPQPTSTPRPGVPTNPPVPTPVPALPQAGTSGPMMIVLSVGLLVILGGLLGLAMW